MASPWLPELSLPALPVKQIQALPTTSAKTFVSSDGAETIIYATHTMKYWSPALVGINGLVPIQTPAASGFFAMTGLWLDVLPCVYFTCVITRMVAPGGTFVQSRNMSLRIQYKQTPADNPPVGLVIGGSEVAKFNSQWLIQTAQIQFPAQASDVTQRYSEMTSPNVGASNTQNVTLCMGPQIRFSLSQSSNGIPPGDTSTYAMAIWGSTN